MERVRWFNSNWAVPINEISSAMLSSQFSSESSNGFILSKKSNHEIYGKFIEKRILVEKNVDPFGEESELKRVIFITTKFIINTREVGLELINPPRGVKLFLSKLQNIVGIGLLVSDIKVDPVKWVNEIENNHKCEVLSISASGIRAEKNGIAKITISGVKDIREEFTQFINEKEHKIDSIKLNLYLNNKPYKVEINKSTSIKIPALDFDEISTIMRNSLQLLTSKANKFIQGTN